MKPVLYLSLLLLIVSSVAPTAQGASRVAPIGRQLVAVPQTECAPEPYARFGAIKRLFSLSGWELVGAEDAAWEISLDLEQANARGISLTELRAVLTAFDIELKRSDYSDVPRAFGSLAAKSRSERVPLEAVATLERRLLPPRKLLTLNGKAVVAAVGDSTTGFFETPLAAAALAVACATGPAQMQGVTLPAVNAEWRLSYRADNDDPPGSFAHARTLEDKFRDTAGLRLGVHEHAGGAVWGFREVGGGGPSPPPDPSTLFVPGLRMLLQGAAKGRWAQPFLAVLRVQAPPGAAGAAFDTAKGIAARAGSRNVMMLGRAVEEWRFHERPRALARHGLELEDVEFVLQQGAPILSAPVRMAMVHPPELGTLHVRGVRGGSVALADLGKLERVRRIEAAPGLRADHVAIYVSIPPDTALEVAKVLAETEIPAHVRIDRTNWRVLREDEALRIMDWWQGRDHSHH